MAYLEIETSEGERIVPLSGDRLSIGRLSYNDISLPSPQISRQHAELRCVDGAWWIVDLNSTNGLHLHGKRVQQYKLAGGDRIVLAPNITVRFIEEPDSTPSTVQPTSTPAPSRTTDAVQRRSTFAGTPKIRRTAGFTASDDSERRTTNPVGRPYPSSGQVYPPLIPPGPMLPEKPRSIFSDDEVPYVPSSMAPPTPPPGSLSPSALDSRVNPSPPSTYDPKGPATIPFSSWSEGASSSPPYAPAERDSGIPQPSNNWNAVGDLYSPAPLGSLPPSATHAQDRYLRSQPGLENDPPGSRESSTTLLHVCQTCGQLTSPESVYCQNCHHSIAHECSSCRLSLLPIQDRCPRCHTPNVASVRRAHSSR
jgi:pSer/pThr/pTyr-binding forkhead associated (FHA) protein